MSYKCQNCHKQQPHNVSPIMTVAKKRNTYYPEVRNEDNEVTHSRGNGWEIVKELACCEKCAPNVASRCQTVRG